MNIRKFYGNLLAKWRTMPRPYRTILRWTIIGIFAIAFDILVLFILTSLFTQNLLDLKTIITLLVVEVLAAVIAKLLRVGEPSAVEERYNNLRLAASKAHLIPQFAYLQAVSLEKEIRSVNYPHSQYRIINKNSKRCYYVPTYINDLVAEEIIDHIVLNDKIQLDEYLRNKGITDENKYPSNDELNIG